MPARLTDAQKKARGTLREDRIRQPRSIEAVTVDISETNGWMNMLRDTLGIARDAIKEHGVFITVALLDSHGKARESKRLNPGFKVVRDSIGALKSLKKDLTLLEDELAAATAKQISEDEFAEFDV